MRCPGLLLLAFCALAAGAPAAQTGTLAGTVTDDRGDALPGATVFVPQIQRGAATNIDGEYAVQKIPVGVYEVQFSSAGFRPQAISGAQISRDRTRSLDVVLALTDPRPEPPVFSTSGPSVFSTSGVFEGVVTDGLGEPVFGAAVVVLGLQSSSVRNVATDIAGRFVVPDLPAGLHQVQVTARGFERETQRIRQSWENRAPHPLRLRLYAEGEVRPPRFTRTERVILYDTPLASSGPPAARVRPRIDMEHEIWNLPVRGPHLSPDAPPWPPAPRR